MLRLHTSCIEGPLRMGFELMGHFIGSHPWWFLITPLIFSISLGSGFYFLNSRMSNNIEKQFTPVDGPAKMERKFMEETFPENHSEFSALRMSRDGIYATLIAASGTNILTVDALEEILDLDVRIRHMEVQFSNDTFKYEDVCSRLSGSCVTNDLLDAIEYNAANIELINLTFPLYHKELRRIPLYLSLGSVESNNGSSVVQNAKALKLFYYLQEGSKSKTDLWLQSFIRFVSNEISTSFQVSYSTSMSRQWEFEKTPASVMYLFSISYAIAIVFSILTCWRLDNVRTKVWLAWCGVLSTGLAILSGFGALLLLGQPFVMTAASCPFMILGIGLDDMFIMISCWQRTRVLDDIPERLAHTYRDAAVSISITTLTDALALFLGYNSSFGAVQSFCLYAGVSVCFCYLYSVTFLGACMALNGRREAGNRHWFTCADIPEDLPPNRSTMFEVCCVGGRYDRISEKEETELVSHILKQYYGPWLMLKPVKISIFVIYLGYLAVSIYGCCILNEGLEMKNLALDDSYIMGYYKHQTEHFSDYGYNVMMAVKQPFSYWDKDERRRLNSCIADFESLNFVNNTFAWFAAYDEYAKALNISISSKEDFYSLLPRFLELKPMFRQDINLTLDDDIQASRFFIHTLSKASKKHIMSRLRKTAENCVVELLVYHPAFIYFDQYSAITDNTAQTVLVAVIAMLVVSLLLIPNPLCSVWVAFAICSVMLGVTGFMSLWGVNLDSISMINLVMCIGFSVDFSAHISYSFVSSTRSDTDEKVKEALAHLGYPIMQGALSTMLAVVVLSFSGSYIFRTFFRIVFLVIGFGLLHSLVFIPVFLTVFGRFGKCY